MRSRLGSALTAWLVVMPAAGIGLAAWQGDRAVREAETRLLEAETATAARLVASGDSARLTAMLGDRWRSHDAVDPLLDQPEVEWRSGTATGRGARHDADGWDTVGQVEVHGDAARRIVRPGWWWLLAAGAVAGLLLSARRVEAATRRTGSGAGLPVVAAAWAGCALGLTLVPVVAAERWAVGSLAALTDRRLDLAGDALRGRDDLGPLARRPSGILDATGLRFVPTGSREAGDDRFGASGLAIDVARALAVQPLPASRRVDVGPVRYAAHDVEDVRLFQLPCEHTERPSAPMAAVAGLGVLAGLPALALLAIAGDARRVRRELVAWSFLAPSVLHLAVFTFGPLLFAAWLSLHRWSLVDAARPSSASNTTSRSPRTITSGTPFGTPPSSRCTCPCR